MTTHKETIEIEVDVRDGFRIKRYGCPGDDDHVMDGNGTVFKPSPSWRDTNFLIVEKVPEPYMFPEWLPGEWWLYRQANELWFVAQEQPIHTDEYGWCNNGHTPSFCVSKYLVWTPPTDAQYAGKPLLVTHKK